MKINGLIYFYNFEEVCLGQKRVKDIRETKNHQIQTYFSIYLFSFTEHFTIFTQFMKLFSHDNHNFED